MVERLHREGDLLLRLTHPHIVRAYAVGMAPLPHLIEETLTGFTLAELLRRRGRLGLQELLHLADHLSAALCYLHDEGILHLDLKPANIVAEAGRVKLIDFSLAHPPGDGPAGWGTHSYLSPEQAIGGSFATATDIWGLGMVLHEAATGREVFSPTGDEGDEGDEGDDEDGTYPQLVMPVPSLRLQRRLPASLRGIIEGCLRPAAEERPDLVQIRAVLDKLLGRTCAFGE